MNITKLIKEHHGAMVDKGFYDCPDCIDSPKKGWIYDYAPDNARDEPCPTCNTTGINPNINIGQSIMLIGSEIMEAVEADRNKNFCDFDGSRYLNLDNIYPPEHKGSYFNNYNIYKDAFEREVKDTLGDEIADAHLRLYDLCGYLEIEPHEVRGAMNWRTKNTADKLREILKVVLNLNPDYPKTNDFKTTLGFIFLYLGIFCKENNIPIEKHIQAKMQYNKTREHLHGKKY